MSMTAEQAQKVVGLGGLAVFVTGPLAMMLPVFFFTPLDRASWYGSLGVGLVISFIPLATVWALVRKGLLDAPQAVLGGGLLLLGTMTLVSGTGLILNGLLDRSEATSHRAQVERLWQDCNEYKGQNSTTRITTCKTFGSFSFPKGEYGTLEKIEVPDETEVESGQVLDVTVRRGVFGWPWGFRFVPQR